MLAQVLFNNILRSHLKLHSRFNSCTKLFESSSKFLRVNCYSSGNASDKDSVKKTDQFIPIYWFPGVRIFAVCNKLKFYQAGSTAVLIPAAFILYQNELCSFDEFQFASWIGISLTASLTLLSMLFNRFVAAIYLNKNGKVIKLSFVNFHGSRVDEIIPIEDLKPFCELRTYSTDRLYLTLQRYSCKDSYKFAAQFGVVLDKKLYDSIFQHSS